MLINWPISAYSAPLQPRDQSLSASLSESVIRLISTCQQVEECLLCRANCISQPVDLHLLRPAISAYSAAGSVPVSRLSKRPSEAEALQLTEVGQQDLQGDPPCALYAQESAPTQPPGPCLSAA